MPLRTQPLHCATLLPMPVLPAPTHTPTLAQVAGCRCRGASAAAAAVRKHAAACMQLQRRWPQPPRAAGPDSSSSSKQLPWSFTEAEAPEQAAAGAAPRPPPREQQRRQQRSSRRPAPPLPLRPHRQHTHRPPVAADAYRQAQQRVQAVLTAADPSNPAAAAEQLPDTVNDLTVALQLLATAPRPSTLAAAKQYEAATQQLAAAVTAKYKRLLLRLLPPASPLQPPPQHSAPPRHGHDDQQQQISAALASLPATKLAATAFSLGVLRLYDRQLVQGLEDASLQLMRTMTTAHSNSNNRGAFKPNQLGQLVQGFVYLDHQLNPAWHAAFVEATRPHLPDMSEGPQVASLAVWMTSYRLCGAASSSCGSSSGSSTVNNLGRLEEPPFAGALAAAAAAAAPQPPNGGAAAVPAAAAAAVSAVQQQQLDPGWIQSYLAAVGRGAGSLRKPLQLVQVLQAAAGLAAAGAGVFDGLPVCLQDVNWSLSHNNASSGRRHSSSSCTDATSWVVSLVEAVQQQLPELTMAHMAAALPPLLQLTQCPWPPRLLQPLLLQVKLQLPGCAGRDLVVVAQAVAHLAGPDALAAAEHQEWCDAVLVQLHSQLPALGPAELAGAVHTAALLRVRPYKAWVYELCQRLRVDARAMDAQQVLLVLEGLAALGVRLDPELLHVFVGQINRWMGSLGARDLGRVVSALRLMYPKVLPGRTVHQLVDELRRRQQFLLLQQAQQQQRQQRRPQQPAF